MGIRRRARRRPVAQLATPTGPLDLVAAILEGEGLDPIRARAVAERIVYGIAGLASETVRRAADLMLDNERRELAATIDAEAELADREREERLGALPVDESYLTRPEDAAALARPLELGAES